MELAGVALVPIALATYEMGIMLGLKGFVAAVIGGLRSPQGAVLGEMSMLDGEPRFASCWALGDVEAAVLTREGVARLIAEQPGVGAKLLVKITQLLAQRLRNTSHQLMRHLKGDR